MRAGRGSFPCKLCLALGSLLGSETCIFKYFGYIYVETHRCIRPSMSHLICMDSERRASLHTNAGGDYDEENGVNYLEITLASYLPELGSERIMCDMDCWGYTFRLGSAKAWFKQDAVDARQWLIDHNFLDQQGLPSWSLRAPLEITDC